MRLEVRKALEAIEDVLMRNNADSYDLAILLSALRGPDEEAKGPRKAVTTARIRALMFPRLALQAQQRDSLSLYDKKTAHTRNWLVNLDGKPVEVEASSYPGPLYTPAGHFELHIFQAVEALNRKDRLTWDTTDPTLPVSDVTRRGLPPGSIID
jgi:hypothetical protein